MTLGDAMRAQLLESARSVRERAHAPFSRFRVGAAVLGESGRIFSGCNVESATYGATLCAERSAIAQMIAEGDRRFVAVAIYTDAEQPAPPCGICRQWIAELGPGAAVVSVTPAAERSWTIDELLPEPFLLKAEDVR